MQYYAVIKSSYSFTFCYIDRCIQSALVTRIEEWCVGWVCVENSFTCTHMDDLLEGTSERVFVSGEETLGDTLLNTLLCSWSVHGAHAEGDASHANV